MVRIAGTLGELLVEHGIPERGARLYLAACRGGPQTAAELARQSGLHRVEAYRFLRALEAEGLLRATGGRPARFVALPLDQLVDRWIRRTTDRLEKLRGDREKILADWKESLTAPEPGDLRKFAVLEGRSTIQRYLRRRLDAAEREVLISSSGFALGPAIEGGVDRSIREAQARGVKVRFVTEATAANLADVKHFAQFTDLRHAESPVTNRAIVIDRSGALVFVSGEEGLGTSGADQVALWTSAPSVLALAREYHQRLWSRGTPFTRRLAELESPSTATLAVVRGREEVSFQRLREITELGMRVTGLGTAEFDLPEMIRTIAGQLGRNVAASIEGTTPSAVAAGLAGYYDKHALGRLEVVHAEPLTLRVTQCFACTPQGPEIGRVMCPKLLQTVFERRLGVRLDVSAPDPRRHATKGCLFTVAPA